MTVKVASRFPVKSHASLIVFVATVHCALLVIAWYELSCLWQKLLMLLILSISLIFSNRQYQLMVNAPDDLCWSGEHWVMHSNQKLKRLIYLDLLPSSWVSRYYCLLHFSNGDKHYYWLFSRHELGSRMYSELVYLVKMNIKDSTSFARKSQNQQL